MIGEILSDDLKVGTTYDVRSPRKGNFWGTLCERRGEFATFRVVSGKAKFLNQEDRLEGEEVSMRLSLCKFYPIKEYVPIPPGRWGKDHWSTFAYVGTRCVDYKGFVDKTHMRTKRDKHPDLEGDQQKMMICDKEYPTRLKGYFEDKTNPDNSMADHDDWDCIEDAIAAGFIIKIDEACYQLTEKGWEVDNFLHQHKASGGQYAEAGIILKTING